MMVPRVALLRHQERGGEKPLPPSFLLVLTIRWEKDYHWMGEGLPLWSLASTAPEGREPH